MKKINKTAETSKKKMNIILYFFIMFAIFIIFDIVSNILISLFGQSVILGKYGQNIITESIYLILILIILLLFKNQYIFKEKKVGLFRGLILGLPLLIILLFNIDLKSLFSANIFDTLSLLIFAVLVGFAEEFLCRGWIQNEMIERYGDNRCHVTISILLSGLLFGLMHIINIFAGQGIIETLSQILQAMAAGFFLGAVYYRSKNIWLVILLHAFWDFALMTGDLNVLKECTFLNPSLKATIGSFLGTICISTIFFTAGLFELRNSKICDNFNEQMTPQIMEKEKIASILTIFAGFAIYYIVSYINYPFLEEYNKSTVCYEYAERELKNYSLTKYHQDSYQIEYELWEEVYDDEKEESELEWIEDYSFVTSLNNSKLTITNEIIDESITLDYDVLDYVVIKSDDQYLIGLLVEEKEGSILYYSDFITEENISNTTSYLNDLKNSFIRFVLPDSTSIVTLLEENSEDPLIAVQNRTGFTYVDDEELYIVYNE